jgi:hypothetical protein
LCIAGDWETGSQCELGFGGEVRTATVSALPGGRREAAAAAQLAQTAVQAPPLRRRRRHWGERRSPSSNRLCLLGRTEAVCKRALLGQLLCGNNDSAKPIFL